MVQRGSTSDIKTLHFSRQLKLAVICIALLITTAAQALTNSGITYHGRIVKPDGTPLEGSNVQFKLQLLSPGPEACLLYSEVQSINMSGSNGVFTISLDDGQGTRSDSTGIAFDTVFSNRNSFSSLPAGDCAQGSTYNPNIGDGRSFVVLFKDENMQAYEQLPAQPVNFAPMAIQAKQIAGFGPTNLLRVDDATSASNATPLNQTQFNQFISLVNGNYVQSTAAGGAGLPVVTAAPTTPAAGSVWYNSSTGAIQFYNGAVTQTLGTSAGGSGTVTSISTGTGLTGGPITSTGTISLANFGTAGTYYKVITDATGRVSSGTTALAESDLPTISTAGKVSGSAITSGTIGGTTVINTTGAITTTGTLTAGNMTTSSISDNTLLLYNSGNTHKITITAPALSADYSLIFPMTAGTAGYVLTTDGSGNLSWTAASGAPSGTAGGDLSGTYPNPSVAKLSGTPLTITTLTSGNFLRYNGTAWVNANISASDMPSLASGQTGILPIANGGTGTSTGSITGSGALTFAAGGSAQNVSILPTSGGYAVIGGTVELGADKANYVTVAGAAAGSAPTIGTAGTDTAGTGLGLNINASGSSTGGAGGTVSINGGNGGLPSGNGNGGGVMINAGSARGGSLGVGGNLWLAAGTGGGVGGTLSLSGGTGTGSTGTGGPVVINGGAAGNSSVGGSVNITGGAVASGQVGDGGAINLTGFSPATVGGTSGAGGAITLTGGNAVGTNRNGGTITLAGGAATGTGLPGSIALMPPVGGGVGIGTTSPAGTLDVEGGTAAASTDGSSINIVAQSGGTGNQNGGSINLTAGNATGTGTYGSIALTTAQNITMTAQGTRTLALIRTNPAQALYFSQGGTGNPWSITSNAVGLGLNAQGNAPMTFATYNTERMRLDSTGRLGIGTTSPLASLDMSATTDALALPSGTTAQEPTTAVAGMIRYNSQTPGVEFYNGTAWTTFSTSGASSFSGVTSISDSTGNITLAPKTSTGAVLVNSGTPSTTSATGALQVTGGEGVSGDIFAGATINAGSSVTAATSMITPQIYGSTAASGNIKIDGTSNATKGNVLLASAGGSVGIGTTSPTSPLHVVSGVIPASTYGAQISSVSTNASALETGLYSYANSSPSAAPSTSYTAEAVNGTAGASNTNVNANTNMIGVAGYGQNGSTGTMNLAVGVQGSAQNLSTGAMTSAVAGNFYVKNATGGSITTASGVTIANPSNSGTIATAYGLYIAPQTAGTTNYAIYSGGGTNYFAGNVGIGTTSPAATLDIAGTANVSTDAGISSGEHVLLSASRANASSTGVVMGYRANGTAITGGYLRGTGSLPFSLGTTGVQQQLVLLNTGDATFSGNVGVGTSSPLVSLDISQKTDALALPKGTTAQEPANAVAGMIRYNSSTPGVEFYNGTAWTTFSTSGASSFSGVTSISDSTGNITLAPQSSTGAVIVNSGTPATTSATGAVQITGGEGVSGDIFAGATINAGSSVTAATSMISPQIYGSTAASGTLKLDGTSNATKGNVLLASAGGNVGIGTTSPQGALDVEGGTAAASTNGSTIFLQGQAAGTGANNAGGGITLIGGAGNGSGAAGAITLSGGSSNFGGAVNITGGVGNNSPGAVTIAGGSATAGNVAGGAATLKGGSANGTAGGGALSLTGGAAGAVGVGGNVVVTSGAGGTSTGNSGNILLMPGTVTSGTAGFVGVGTTSPSYSLDVNGNVNYVGVLSQGGITVLTRNSGSTNLRSGAGIGFSVNGSSTISDAIDVSGNLGIGTTSPTVSLDIGAKTDALRLPNGTTAQEPTTALAGMIRYNTSTPGVEFYNGTAWSTLSTSGASSFSGVTSISDSTGNITLAPQSSTGAVIVNSGTPSTSTTTGAVQITGGEGVSGSIYSGASVSAATSVITPQIYGSTVASGNVLIDGTSNATKGNVLLASAGGSVGIGTASPAAALDIWGSGSANVSANGYSSFSANAYSSSTGVSGSMTFHRAEGTFASQTYPLTGDWLGAINFRNQNNSTTSAAIIAQATENQTSTADGGNLLFQTAPNGTANAVTRMLIDQNGQVGIGTSVPAALLDVQAINSNPQIRITNTTSTAADYPALFITDYTAGNGGSAGVNVVASRGSLASPVAVASGDSLGTFSSWGQYDSTAGHIGQGAYLNFLAEGAFSSTSYPTAISFSTTTASSTAPAERMRIANSGYVGIGTGSPAAPLHLNATTALFGTTTTTGGAFVYNNTGSNGYFGIYDSSNSVVYGISRQLPAPSGTATLGGYYGGLGVGGSTSTASTPIFGVLSSSESGNGFGATAFTVYGGTKVQTYHNTLDDSNGNVGIGTSSPMASLDLATRTDAIILPKGTTAQEPSSAVAGMIRWNTTTAGIEYYSGSAWSALGGGSSSTLTGVTSISDSTGNITLAPQTSTGAVIVNSGTASTSTTTGAVQISGGEGVSGSIYSGATVSAATSMIAPQIYGSTAASGNIKIDGTSNGTAGNVLLASAGGNVGIGSTSPTQPLDVSGNAQVSGNLILKQTNSQFTSFGGIPVIQSTGANANTYFAIQPSGSNTTAGLVIVGTSAYGSTSYTQLQQSGVNTSIANQSPTGTLSLGANGGSQINIIPNGNVGVGTTSPSQPLTVAGTAQASNFASPVQSLSYSSTITLNMSSGANAAVTLTGNATLAITNAVAGTTGLITVTQDSTGNRTLTLPSGSKVAGGGGGIAYLSTAASAIDVLSFYYDGTTYFWNIGRNYN